MLYLSNKSLSSLDLTSGEPMVNLSDRLRQVQYPVKRNGKQEECLERV